MSLKGGTASHSQAAPKCPRCGSTMTRVCDPKTRKCTWVCPKCG